MLWLISFYLFFYHVVVILKLSINIIQYILNMLFQVFTFQVIKSAAFFFFVIQTANTKNNKKLLLLFTFKINLQLVLKLV